MGKAKAAILGAGPSAAYALAALREMNIDTEIFSDRISTAPIGRTWYREVPPAIRSQLGADPVFTLSLGNKKTYMARMGRPEDAQSAFPLGLPETTLGYNPQKVRELLMPDNTPMRIVKSITDDDIADISRQYDYVFLTFATQKSRRAQPARVRYPVLVADRTTEDIHPNLVVYNGTEHLWWTRYTMFWGVACWEFSHLEYPDEKRLPPAPYGTHYLFTVDFGVGTIVWDPTDVPGQSNVYPVGRWARWDKTIHTHDAYHEVLKILEA